MILPSKHIETRRSLLNVGASLLERLDQPRTVSALWESLHQVPEVGSFETFTLALDFLYMVGLLDFAEGLLRRAHP